VQVLEASTDPQASADPPQLCGRSDRTKFRDQVVRPLLEAGLPDMMIPSKPRNSRQRDRTTKAGKEVLSE
jgi:ATP-dependent DNA helicase RecG